MKKQRGNVWDSLRSEPEIDVTDRYDEAWFGILDLIEKSGLSMGRIYYLKRFLNTAREKLG